MTLAQYGGVKYLGSARCASYLPRLQYFRSLVSESGGCMYRIAIVEDNPESYEKLTKYLKRYSEEYKVPLKSTVFTNGLNFISDYRGDYDVVLMDIEMPHMNGMELARQIREADENVCLIFVTGLAQYAVEGYEVRALDYMLKPVEYPNFALKLRRALGIREQNSSKELHLSRPDGMVRLGIENIFYVEVVNHTLYYHMHLDHQTYEERGSIASLEKLLEPYGFARCSISYLLNLRYVTATSGNQVTSGGRVFSLSRTRRKDFLEKLAFYLGKNSL